MEAGRIPRLVPHGVEDSIMTDSESFNTETDMATYRDDSTVDIKREVCSDDDETVLEGPLERPDWVVCEDEKISALESDGEKNKAESIDYRFDKGDDEGFDMVVRNEDIKIEIDHTAELNTESKQENTTSRVLLTLNDKPNVVVDSFCLRSFGSSRGSESDENEVNYTTAVPQGSLCGSQALKDYSTAVHESLGQTSSVKSDHSMWSVFEIKEDRDFTILSVNEACCTDGQTTTPDIPRHFTYPGPSSTVLGDVLASEASYGDGQTTTPDIPRYFTYPGPSSTVLGDVLVSKASNRGGETAIPKISRRLNDPDRYKCNVCSKQFTTSSNLKSHVRLHSGSKPYQCDVCFKRFSRSDGLKGHQTSHSGIKPYMCNVCSKLFRTSSHLKRHERVHSGSKPYTCDVCPKRFSTSSALKVHERVHSGSKPHECDVCFKQFSTSWSLKTHQRVHSGSKPYKCDVCSKQFSQSANLMLHKNVHSGSKPYKCDVCSKQFSTPSNLRSHERIHSGSKPYQCDVCSKQFRTSSHLKRHERVSHSSHLKRPERLSHCCGDPVFTAPAVPPVTMETAGAATTVNSDVLGVC